MSLFFARSVSAAPPAAASVGNSAEATELPAPDLPQRALIAAKLYSAVTTYFAHAEALPPDYDFQIEFQRFLDEAFEARTRLAFDKAAMRLMGSLRNGHTGFTDSVMRKQSSLPFRAQRIDGRWIVTRSQLAAGAAGLDPGQEILTLNGASFENWIRANLVFVQESNLAESESMLMATAFLWPQRFTLGLADGHMVTIDRAESVKAPWRGLDRPDAVSVTEPEQGVVRIVIPGFDDSRFETAALEAVKQHVDARVILFDVRGNGGGSTPQRLLSSLIDTPYRDMEDSTPLHIGTIDAWSEVETPILPNAMLRTGGEWIQPDHPLFHGKVLVLADRHCASACEDFVLALHVSHRGTILGETTYGSTGQPFMIEFPKLGMSLRVSTRREYLPGLLPFEGVGVAPDVAIPLTVDALRAGRDQVLQQALEIAARGR